MSPIIILSKIEPSRARSSLTFPITFPPLPLLIARDKDPRGKLSPMGLAEASPPSTISLIEIKTKLKPEARQKKGGTTTYFAKWCGSVIRPFY